MTPETGACEICGTFDPKCQRKDCRYRCDPVLTEWDAELVETQGKQFPEIASAQRVDELLDTAEAERWTEADILAELEPLARSLERTVAEMREVVEDAAGNDCYHYEKWLHQKPCGKCQSCKARVILARLDGSKP